MTGLRPCQSALYRLIPRLIPVVVLSLAASIAVLGPTPASALQSGAVPPAAVRPKPAGAVKLTNHIWRLVALHGHDLDATVTKPPQMNLIEEDFRIVGFAGCNRFLGTYLVHQAEFTVNGDLVVTRMTCHSSMDLETDFIQALRSVDSWKIVDGMLELSHQKEVVARFKAV